MECIHKEVCKFFKAEVIVEKILEIPIEKKRGRPYKDGRCGPKNKRVLTNSKADIKQARMMLKKRKSRGDLTVEQINALETTDHIHYKKLSEGQKEQILSILKESYDS